ncbi:hypothetical protein ATO6_23480 [Oceanicola sp. 22II-s10i]|nr:hypothetical protein ATO6_23480 [Oceanicola sp. 22II-s10i]
MIPVSRHSVAVSSASACEEANQRIRPGAPTAIRRSRNCRRCRRAAVLLPRPTVALIPTTGREPSRGSACQSRIDSQTSAMARSRSSRASRALRRGSTCSASTCGALRSGRRPSACRRSLSATLRSACANAYGDSPP